MAILHDLERHLRPLLPAGVAVAFSGGVDSAVLLAVLARMRDQQGFPLQAWYLASPFQARAETDLALELATGMDVPLTVLPLDILNLPSVRNNPPDRCYHCKRAMFEALRQAADAAGLAHLLEGSHRDDGSVYRPGRRALQELGVLSPFAACGIGKTEIRRMAAELHLPCARKPAAPCLATRFPYGTCLEPAALRRVEAGETAIRQLIPGLQDLRLRCHGELVRLEVAETDAALVLARRRELTNALRSLGFTFITLDLEGLRSGCFDPDRSLQ